MREGIDALLATVSRSFYLTIRVLPRGLRTPVGLAYLLARTSDTIADSASASPEARLDALRQMGEALGGREPMPDLTPFASGVSNPSERALLEWAGTLCALLHASEPHDRVEIVWVINEILSGQRLDLTRFAQTGDAVKALATAEELEDYTYRVAGCVGAFWTRICSRHLRDYAPSLELEALVQLGVSFGKGLQLINILRDGPADLAQGRCYLPSQELPEENPELLKTAPMLVRPVQDRWVARARAHLEDGLHYIEAVRPWRLRLACFLPWAIGVRTLKLIEHTRPLEQDYRVKVPRREVRSLLFLGVLGALGNGTLRRVARRVQEL
jgi:farnesyl-diphosphate farnesyltransferase